MLDLSQALQIAIGGLTAGSIYALVGLGFIVVYQVSRVANLAQGEFLTLGALVLITLVSRFSVPLIVAMLVAVALVSCVGLALERLLVRPARRGSISTLLIVTIGASIFLKGVAQLVWGKELYSVQAFSGNEPILLLGAGLQTQALWVFGTIATTALLLWLLFDRTLFGKALLACSENPMAASLVGINTQAMVRFSFALAAALGALAGIVIAPITFVTFDSGTLIGLKGFIAVALGGMRSYPLTVVGGLFLGLLEAFGAGYVSSLFKDVFAFVLLLVALVAWSYRGGRAELA